MSEPQFACDTHNAELYDHAHILEHKCYSRGPCDVSETNPQAVGTPENSHNDLDN